MGAIHPFYTASMRVFQQAGRPIVGSAPVGLEGTSSWLERIGEAAGIAPEKVAAAKEAVMPGIAAALAGAPIEGKITVSGYEGS